MRWFDGNIVDAVKLSKSKNAYFVVYIEGTGLFRLMLLWKVCYFRMYRDGFLKINMVLRIESKNYFDLCHLISSAQCQNSPIAYVSFSIIDTVANLTIGCGGCRFRVFD